MKTVYSGRNMAFESQMEIQILALLRISSIVYPYC